MAISTYKVFLMHKASSEGTYTKLIDIKEFPDLGGEPEMLETTTLSDNMQTYIAGIQSMDGLSFSANYDMTDYQIQAMCNEHYIVPEAESLGGQEGKLRCVVWRHRERRHGHSRWLQRQVRI